MENQGRICPRGASYYTWQAGDTLRSVSQQAGTTVHILLGIIFAYFAVFL